MTNRSEIFGLGITRFLAGSVFSVGLVLVIVAGAELFTGNNLIIVGLLTGEVGMTVDPNDTTKECASCGVKTEKPLWVREHSCPSCGFEADRDANAA